MPTIRITTDRQPWVDGRPLASGAEVDVPQVVADDLVAKGFAEAVRAKRVAKTADAADAE